MPCRIICDNFDPCTVITAPCRTLQRDINTVLAGGEVRLLTSLQGNAVITKSLSIAGDGATIVGTIVVNSASAVVTLRGLALDGFNGFANGVDIDAAAVVPIQDCTIERRIGDVHPAQVLLNADRGKQRRGWLPDIRRANAELCRGPRQLDRPLCLYNGSNRAYLGFRVHNDTGLEVTVGGTLLTLGNNVVDGNTAETSGTITPLAPL